MTAVPRPTRPLLWAGGVIGFALGGFFDGILLHQVLQWHHFFSLVPGERWRELRNLILMDGVFHVAVYAVAALGLCMLWRARGGFAVDGADRALLGAALLGFGAWQVVDVGVFHWIVGIHRIRVDVPNPLAWDVGWLVVVGVPPLALGWWLLRRGGGSGRRGAAAAVALALAILGSAPLAALPAPGEATTLVVFRDGVGLERQVLAAAAAGARVIRSEAGMATLALDEGANPWALYRHGAILVGRASPAGGCAGWARL